MRRIVCDQLATLTRIRAPDTTDTTDVRVDLRDVDLASNNVKQLDVTSTLASSTAAASSSAGSSISSVERLLSSINDLLETRVRSDAQLRLETDKHQQMYNDWMLAAAVIDRICFIIFSMTLVVASLVFAMLLFFHA